mmetsp:Transcript_13755/g.37234  ORF Transcript_13755/g.37234 Transcript_13755/m.37234 type:complete len:210 (-) Transcript_13755:381-1010(-)
MRGDRRRGIEVRRLGLPSCMGGETGRARRRHMGASSALRRWLDGDPCHHLRHEQFARLPGHQGDSDIHLRGGSGNDALLERDALVLGLPASGLLRPLDRDRRHLSGLHAEPGLRRARGGVLLGRLVGLLAGLHDGPWRRGERVRNEAKGRVGHQPSELHSLQHVWLHYPCDARRLRHEARRKLRGLLRRLRPRMLACHHLTGDHRLGHK